MIHYNLAFKDYILFGIMQDFEVRGGYTHCGTKGTFCGAFRFLEDNRVVGTMIDSGADIKFNAGRTKVVLGFREGDFLGFLKFSPSSSTMPLVYALNGSDNQYRGKWFGIPTPISSFVEGSRGLPEILESFGANSTEQALDILGRIEKSRTDHYLDPEFIRKVLLISNETGYLSLSKVNSFAA